jgi:septum formation protein
VSRPLLILGSTSPSRRELLSRLGVPFETAAPDYDEARLPGIEPSELARRHALGKARSVALCHRECIVIGSDQVAEVEGEILEKPGTEERAVAQLLRMAGQKVSFHTGLAVLAAGLVPEEQVVVERYSARVRRLTAREAENYVRREQPLECAGSFKIEGLGIALMEELEGRDYTALIGLPLIALADLLRRLGLNVLML